MVLVTAVVGDGNYDCCMIALLSILGWGCGGDSGGGGVVVVWWWW